MGWKSHKLCYETSKWNILRLTSTTWALYPTFRRNMFILFHFIFLSASLAINYFLLFFIIVIILIYVPLFFELVQFLMLRAFRFWRARGWKENNATNVGRDDKRRDKSRLACHCINSNFSTKLSSSLSPPLPQLSVSSSLRSVNYLKYFQRSN